MERPVTEFASPYAPPPPPPPAAAGPARTSGMAITSMILGLLGFCCGGITSIIAVPLGIAAIVSVGRSGGRLTGGALGWIGVITGILSVVLYIGLGVSMGPKAVRFYAGMGQAATASEEMMQALKADNVEGAYEATGEKYRGAHPRAEFEAHVNTWKAERGSLVSATMVNLDQTSWFKVDSGDPFSTTLEYTLEWSNGNSTTLLLVWTWAWFDDLEKLPVPDLESIEMK